MAIFDRAVKSVLLISTVASILVTVLIIVSISSETLRFFSHVSLSEFFFGTEWSPQTAIRSDQAGSSGTFGAVPVFFGTLMIAFIAMIVATPLGLMSAIYLSVYASPRFRKGCKPILEILAGVPTVVYGYFAVVALSPLLRAAGDAVCEGRRLHGDAPLHLSGLRLLEHPPPDAHPRRAPRARRPEPPPTP